MFEQAPAIDFAARRRAYLRRRAIERGEDPDEAERIVSCTSPIRAPEPINDSGFQYADFVPDLNESMSAAAAELNRLVDTIGILEIYQRVYGFRPVSERNRVEGIKVLCPIHKETNPSAWVNTEKDLLMCAHSWSGLNKYGLYALGRSLVNVPENFHLIKRVMVLELRGVDPYFRPDGEPDATDTV